MAYELIFGKIARKMKKLKNSSRYSKDNTVQFEQELIPRSLTDTVCSTVRLWFSFNDKELNCKYLNEITIKLFKHLNEDKHLDFLNLEISRFEVKTKTLQKLVEVDFESFPSFFEWKYISKYIPILQLPFFVA